MGPAGPTGGATGRVPWGFGPVVAGLAGFGAGAASSEGLSLAALSPDADRSSDALASRLGEASSAGVVSVGFEVSSSAMLGAL
jgi:hypothetical protein